MLDTAVYVCKETYYEVYSVGIVYATMLQTLPEAHSGLAQINWRLF
jgi:hypothetical protein